MSRKVKRWRLVLIGPRGGRIKQGLRRGKGGRRIAPRGVPAMISPGGRVKRLKWFEGTFPKGLTKEDLRISNLRLTVQDRKRLSFRKRQGKFRKKFLFSVSGVNFDELAKRIVKKAGKFTGRFNFSFRFILKGLTPCEFNAERFFDPRNRGSKMTVKSLLDFFGRSEVMGNVTDWLLQEGMISRRSHEIRELMGEQSSYSGLKIVDIQGFCNLTKK